MAKTEIAADERLDILMERKHRVRRLAKDGATKLTGDVPEAYSCPNAGTCTFGDVMPTGGTPCSNCRHFVKGDYYVQQPKEE